MNLFVCFLLVVSDLVTARQLDIINEHSKDESAVRRNVQGLSYRYGPISDTANSRTLKILEVQLSELKHLIMDQGIILKRLAKDQTKLIKERDKNRKRHKFAKKYLRKIYHSCKCGSQWFDPREGHQRDDASLELLSNVLDDFSQGDVATVTDVEVGVTNQTSVQSITQINEEQTEYDVPDDVDIEDITNDDVTDVVVDSDIVQTTPMLTIFDRPYRHTKHFIAEAASGKTFVSRIPVDESNPDAQTTPRLTIFDRPYIHTKQFVAEAASGKGFVSRIPVAEEKQQDYDQGLENGILRDESKADVPITSPAEDFVSLTKDGRTWPDVARYVMGPFTGEYDVVIDLAVGHVIGNHSSIKIVEAPLPGIASHCIQQSVVKLAFGKPGSSQRHDAVLIDMTFDTPRGWVFNIGDSSTNDGRSGDSSKQENDCEIDGFGTIFSVYGSDKSPDPWSKLLYQKNEFVKERLSMVITDQAVVWNNFAGNLDFVKDASLFALKGQPDDQGPVNYDIFLGLNRVIGGYYRSGRGLCVASMKWL